MSSSPPQPYGGAYNSVYSSSIFGPKPSPLQSQSQSYRNKLQSPLVQNRQDKLNRPSLCLKRHQEAAKEVDFLDQENSHLVDVDVAPNKQLSDLIEKEKATSSKAVRRWPFGIVSGIRRLSIDGNSSTQKGDDVDVGRIFLPESISVRSNDYVKLPPMTAALTPNAAGLQIAKPVSASQKVSAQGGKKGQVSPKSEVFNHGMFKTELCNKWQESGDCRYKDHYEFAQAGDELCPVSCQRRYKSKVCKMVLRSDDVCPFGHHRQFCHALTEEEKQLAGGNNKPSR